MRVGSIELDGVADAVGLIATYGEAYPEVPAEAWAPYRELYPELFEADHWRLPARNYLVRTGETTILVDTGVGPPGLWDWTALSEGELPDALAALGVAPGDIDIVFLTHLHIDHVGWNTDLEGVPLFPRARHVVHRDALAFASSQDTRPHVRRCILPLVDRFEQVTGEVELAPGATAFEATGHYPGHMVVRLESDGDPAECAKTRHALLPGLVDQDVIVACGHYPDDGIGRIVRRNGVVAWEALS